MHQVRRYGANPRVKNKSRAFNRSYAKQGNLIRGPPLTDCAFLPSRRRAPGPRQSLKENCEILRKFLGFR